MLKTLRVLNFALIEEASIDFTAGLNILTGETGAGKSILIDAFGVILGNRASVDYISTGSDMARVEAVFDITGHADVHRLLDHQGLTIEEDGTLIVSRRFMRSGKNTITVNACHVTAGFLRQLAECLVDMHGQHENQSLLQSQTQLALLDNFNAAAGDALARYRAVYGQWRAVTRELAEGVEQSRQRAQRLDMLRWQTDEIAAAGLNPTQDGCLEEELKVLANAEKIVSTVAHVYEVLSQGARGDNALLDRLAQAKRELESVVLIDKRLQAQLDVIADALYQLEDCSQQLRSYYETMEFDPQRLAAVEERLAVIDRLGKKYGSSIEDMMAYYAQACRELEEIVGYDDKLSLLERRKQQLEQQLVELAAALTTVRCANAALLGAEIQSHLINLGMPKAKFTIAVTASANFTASGVDQIGFLFSANAGQALQPVYKVASGGELSRLALAVKTVCAARDGVGTMVFDEIDTGIGGQTAQMVAEKIALAAVAKQVICITHLPQIAAMADCHIYIEKQADEERTVTRIRSLAEHEQLAELARMMSGSVTAAAIENAAQMLKLAIDKKENWKKTAQI